MTYQWTKNGADIAGATKKSYTTPPVTSVDNGSVFAVRVTNPGGTVTSNNAILTVRVPPSITTQPADVTVTIGKTAKFTVIASGTTPLTYQWKKNGTDISGATKSSYVTPKTVASDNGSLFSVVVSNAAGSVTSRSALLTVK